eukprot:760739-Prorocentrum_minimum.AAC.2
MPLFKRGDGVSKPDSPSTKGTVKITKGEIERNPTQAGVGGKLMSKLASLPKPSLLKAPKMGLFARKDDGPEVNKQGVLAGFNYWRSNSRASNTHRTSPVCKRIRYYPSQNLRLAARLAFLRCSTQTYACGLCVADPEDDDKPKAKKPEAKGAEAKNAEDKKSQKTHSMFTFGKGRSAALLVQRQDCLPCGKMIIWFYVTLVEDFPRISSEFSTTFLHTQRMHIYPDAIHGRLPHNSG